MANNLYFFSFTSGNTLYSVFQQINSLNSYWNATTAAFESYNSANWTAAKYCVEAVEENATNGDGPGGTYATTIPALAAGTYLITTYYQPGGSPATSDGPARYQDYFIWDGTNIVFMSSGGGSGLSTVIGS